MQLKSTAGRCMRQRADALRCGQAGDRVPARRRTWTTRSGSCRRAGSPGTATPCWRSICLGTAARKGRRCEPCRRWRPGSAACWMRPACRGGGPRRPFHGRRDRARSRGGAGPAHLPRSPCSARPPAFPVNAICCCGPRASSRRGAYGMMTAWALGAAPSSAASRAGTVDEQASLALFARNAPGVLLRRPRGLQHLEIRAAEPRAASLPDPDRHRRATI